jgi:ankyrin repeat protein
MPNCLNKPTPLNKVLSYTIDNYNDAIRLSDVDSNFKDTILHYSHHMWNNIIHEKNLNFREIFKNRDSAIIFCHILCQMDKVNIKDVSGDTALMLVAHYGYDECMDILCKVNFDVNIQNDSGGTALMAAALNGRDEYVEMLCERGAKLDMQDDMGCTALLRAAIWGRYKCVKILCAKGADVNIKDDKGATAYHFAVVHSYKKCISYKKCMKILCEWGVDINKKDNRGRTALDWYNEKMSKG